MSASARGDFGVWKVWEELRARESSWTFQEGPGLGVWQKPPGNSLAEPLEALFTAPNDYSRELADYYRERAVFFSL